MTADISLFTHVTELRRRLFYCVFLFAGLFFISFFFARDIFNILLLPLEDLWQGEAGRRIIFTALHEQFLTEIKLAFFSAFVFSFPLMAIQIWIFVAPGLYKKEKRAFLPFMAMTPLLFFVGIAFVYFIVMPVAWGFFSGFEQVRAEGQLSIELEPRAGEYLSLVMRLMIVFGFSFELPVLLLLLIRAGIISLASLRQKRRYAIVTSFIVAAIVTPPDPVSQLALALPLILLYELSILGGYWVERRKKQDA